MNSRTDKNLQATTIEFTVHGALDGITPCPDVNDVGKILADNMVHVDVQGSLGLIDMNSFPVGTRGAFGDRYGQWILLVAQNPDGLPVNLEVAVVDARLLEIGQPPLPIEVVADESSSNTTMTLYHKRCFFVPAGCALQLSGAPPLQPSQTPHVIRLNFVSPDSVWSQALLEQSCCCNDGGGGGDECPCPTVNPTTVPPSRPANLQNTVTITGSNFDQACQRVEVIGPDSNPFPTDNVNFISDTSIAVTLTPTLVGTYTLVVVRDEPSQCQGTATLNVVDS